MKRLYIVTFLFLLVFGLSAQDIIYKRSGDTLCTKVLEISDGIVKYRLIENSVDPIQSIRTYDVYSIKYENGKEEHFKPKNSRKDRFFFQHKDTYYYSLSLGFGQSYGGFGLRFQGRIGRTIGFGYHAGLGVVPPLTIKGSNYKGGVWFSLGAKFFWYRGWYLDVQFGSVGQYPDNTRGGNTAYGPSFLIGGDWFFSEKYGMNGALGLSVSTPTEKETLASPTFDIGFVFKF